LSIKYYVPSKISDNIKMLHKIYLFALVSTKHISAIWEVKI